MHTKRQEKESPLIFYTKRTQELRDSCSRLSRGVETESTILDQNSSGSRWNGVIRYLQGRRNSRVLRQMESHGYSLWDEKDVIIVNSVHCTEKLRSVNARFRRVLRTRIMSELLFLYGNARPHTSILTTETDQFWMNSIVASTLLS